MHGRLGRSLQSQKLQDAQVPSSFPLVGNCEAGEEWQEAPALLEEGRVITTGNRALEMQSWVPAYVGCWAVSLCTRTPGVHF